MSSKQDALKAVTNSQPSFCFKRRDHYLSSAKDFQAIYKQARRINTPFFRLYYAPNPTGEGRFAVAATRKTGSAVVRNRCKRRFREILRKNQYQIGRDYDMIFFINRRSYDRDFDTVSDALLTALQQITQRQTI